MRLSFSLRGIIGGPRLEEEFSYWLKLPCGPFSLSYHSISAENDKASHSSQDADLQALCLAYQYFRFLVLYCIIFNWIVIVQIILASLRWWVLLGNKMFHLNESNWHRWGFTEVCLCLHGLSVMGDVFCVILNMNLMTVLLCLMRKVMVHLYGLAVIFRYH